MSRPEDGRPADLVGTAVQRREDPALLTGEAAFTDDLSHPGGLWLSLCRSQYGHARIEGIDASRATARDGVLAVHTAADVDRSEAPGTIRNGSVENGRTPDHPLLARDRVRFQGQPVAAVVAEDRQTAADAAAAVEIAYDRLPAVVDPGTARDGDAPSVHGDVPDNVAFEWETGDGAATDAALDAADRVIDLDLDINRVAPTAMEPRAAAVDYDAATGGLSLALTTQNPHRMREDVSRTLGVPADRIDVRSPAVGGGFGGKLQPYPGYLLAAWCALRHEQPVSWTAARTEEFLSMVHSRSHRVSVRAGVSDAGDIEALRAETVAPVGAFLVSGGALVPKNVGWMLSGQYEIPAAHVHTTGVFTNTAPLAAYRGAGRPEATYVTERTVRAIAAELGVDPVALRRRNVLEPNQFPHDTGLGRIYDSGDYDRTLSVALEALDYDRLRDRQARLRQSGRYLGVGFSAYVEACGAGPGTDERGAVAVESSGTVVVRAGTAEIGTGHRTGYAQVVADELGVDLDAVDVREGDTRETDTGEGTFGSRAIPVAGSALAESATAVGRQARRIAAHHLEAAVEDVVLEAGECRVRGAPDRSVELGAVAEMARDPDRLPADLEPGLDASVQYDPPNYTFPFGTHAAVVEVDPETGAVDVERYVAVDDVGTQINPTIVEGQIHGGVAQGIGQALYEEAVYDDNGSLVTGSLQDYAVPGTGDVPPIEWHSTTTPTPHNPLGAKGVGEAGAIAAPPAVVNAVVDALEPFGVEHEHLRMPLTAERVWRTIHGYTGRRKS